MYLHSWTQFLITIECSVQLFIVFSPQFGILNFEKRKGNGLEYRTYIYFFSCCG